MKDERRTKEQLIEELAEMRHRITELEASETQRQWGEEALRESEERFRTASQITSDVVYERELQTGIATFYGDIDTKLGYDLGEYPRTWEGWREHVHPEDLARLERKTVEQFQPDVPYTLEYRMRKKDGTYMTWSDRVMIIWDEGTGRSLRAVGAATDITERRLAEKALKESEERYRALFENSIEGVFAVDLAGNFTSCNKAAAELYGYTTEELLGRSYKTIVAPGDAERIFQEYNKLFRTGEPIRNLVYELITRNGERRLAEGYANVIREGDRIVGFQGTLRDIRERKRAEEQLVRLSNAVRMSTDSIVISDLEGKILEANEATLRMYGTDDRRDLIGKNTLDFVVPEDRDKVLAAAKDVLSEGYVKGLEYHVVTKEGDRIPVEMSVAVMKDARGEPTGTVGVSRDMTERRAAEEEIHRLGQYLRSVIDNADVVLDVIDREGNVLLWNKAAEAISGYSREEVVGHNKVWNWLYPDREQRRAIGSRAAAVMDGEMLEDSQWTIRTKGGEDRTLSFY
jgi:PAS domain S-box-containing protein